MGEEATVALEVEVTLGMLSLIGVTEEGVLTTTRRWKVKARRRRKDWCLDGESHFAEALLHLHPSTS